MQRGLKDNADFGSGVKVMTCLNAKRIESFLRLLDEVAGSRGSLNAKRIESVSMKYFLPEVLFWSQCKED